MAFQLRGRLLVRNEGFFSLGISQDYEVSGAQKTGIRINMNKVGIHGDQRDLLRFFNVSSV